MKDAAIDPAVVQPGEASIAVEWNPMDRRFAAAAAALTQQGTEMAVGDQIDPGSSLVSFANLAEILKKMSVLLVIGRF